jgi:hypothetical protein
MTPTSMGHDLTRNDPAGGHYAKYDPAVAASSRRWSNVTPEQMREVVALWKSRWKCNRRDVG